MPYNPFPKYRAPAFPTNRPRRGPSDAALAVNAALRFAEMYFYTGMKNKRAEQTRQADRDRFLSPVRGLQGPTPSGETLDVTMEKQYGNFYDMATSPVGRMLPDSEYQKVAPNLFGEPTNAPPDYVAGRKQRIAELALNPNRTPEETEEYDSLLHETTGRTSYASEQAAEPTAAESEAAEIYEGELKDEKAWLTGGKKKNEELRDKIAIVDQMIADGEVRMPENVRDSITRALTVKQIRDQYGTPKAKEGGGLTTYQKASLGYRERTEQRAIAKQEADEAAKLLPDKEMNAIKATFGVKSLGELTENMDDPQKRDMTKVKMVKYLKDVVFGMDPETQKRHVDVLEKAQLITRADIDAALGNAPAEDAAWWQVWK